MVRQVKVLFAKTKSLSSDPRIHKVEEKHLLFSHVLYSDLMRTPWHHLLQSLPTKKKKKLKEKQVVER